MAIDPVKIPQNVYIEDRIVGPFTLRQTMIVAIGGGFSYWMYTALVKANGGHLDILSTALAWTPCAIAAIFAFIKINDLSLFRVCLLFFEHMNKPAQRMWEPRRGLAIHIRTMTEEETKKREKNIEQEKKATAEATADRSRLQELSAVLDKPLSNTQLEETIPTPEAEKDDAAAEEPIEKPTEPATHFPVDKNRIKTDEGAATEQDDGLGTFHSVFRDISPNP